MTRPPAPSNAAALRRSLRLLAFSLVVLAGQAGAAAHAVELDVHHGERVCAPCVLAALDDDGALAFAPPGVPAPPGAARVASRRVARADATAPQPRQRAPPHRLS